MLGTVYLGAYFNFDATCVQEIKSRLAIGRERMAQLNTLWRSRAISNPLKAQLIQALIWPIVTYGADAWTLNKELTGNIEAFEMQCYRRSMKVPYTEHVTNEYILEKVQRERGLLANVKSHKLKHFGHTARHNSLAKDIMLGPMQGKRRQGGQRKQWADDLREWTGGVSPFQTWSAWRKIEQHIFGSFMLSPTLDNGYGKLHFTSLHGSISCRF